MLESIADSAATMKEQANPFPLKINVKCSAGMCGNRDGTYMIHTGKTVCSGHIINQRVLTELLLIDIRFKAALAQNQPNNLKEKIMAQKNAAGLEQRKTLQATMDALDKRLAERRSKLEQRTKLSAQLEACQEDEKATDDWLTMIRDYSKMEELERPTLLRLVKRIEVGERRTVNGHDKRDIKIYYNFVGCVKL